MITSKSAVGGDGDGSCADSANTIERNAPAQRQFCFISIDGIEHPAWRKSQQGLECADTSALPKADLAVAYAVSADFVRRPDSCAEDSARYSTRSQFSSKLVRRESRSRFRSMIQQPPCGGRALCRWCAAVRETHASWHHCSSPNEHDTSMEKKFGRHTQREFRHQHPMRSFRALYRKS